MLTLNSTANFKKFGRIFTLTVDKRPDRITLGHIYYQKSLENQDSFILVATNGHYLAYAEIDQDPEFFFQEAFGIPSGETAKLQEMTKALINPKQLSIHKEEDLGPYPRYDNVVLAEYPSTTIPVIGPEVATWIGATNKLLGLAMNSMDGWASGPTEVSAFACETEGGGFKLIRMGMPLRFEYKPLNTRIEPKH